MLIMGATLIRKYLKSIGKLSNRKSKRRNLELISFLFKGKIQPKAIRVLISVVKNPMCMRNNWAKKVFMSLPEG